MYLILIILWNLSGWLSTGFASSTTDYIINEEEIKKKIQYLTEENITNIEKKQIKEKLKSALNAISEKKYSKIKIEEYQEIINNFASIIYQLNEENNYESNYESNLKNYKNINSILPTNKIRSNLLQINQKLEHLDQELQKEQNLARSVNDSLISLPQEHAKTQKELHDINQKISFLTIKTKTSALDQSKLIELQTKKEAKQIKITELELAQLSANYRQELSRLRIELLKNKYDRLDKESQTLHMQLHDIRQEETQQTIKDIETLATTTEKNDTVLKNIIQEQLQTNRCLSESLKKQTQYINLIIIQQRKVASQSLQTRQTLSKLLEQAPWIKQSSALGETLRAQISKLPKQNIYKISQLNNKMTKLREHRLKYEEQINKLSFTLSQSKKNVETLTPSQKEIFSLQINTQRKLLNSLLTNCDIQILELTKLKIAYEQLKGLTKEIEKFIHRYLFWIADATPINSLYLYKTYQDLYLLLNKDIPSQFIFEAKTSVLHNIKIIILLFIVLLVIYFNYTKYRNKYCSFLEKSNKKLNTPIQNNFSLMLQNILWSIVITLPLPILGLVIGYNLSQTWKYPIAEAIGEGILFSIPILWFLLIISYFSLKNGLFISHFKWEKEKIYKAFQYYTPLMTTIVFFTIILITFNNYNNKQFYDTLGRFCFIILCICLTSIAYKLKQANLPLYTNKNESSNNIINQSLWNITICSPIINASAAYFGYLATSQYLLTRLEISFSICLISSIIYYTCKCWVITQKNKILSNHTKKNEIIPTKKKNQKILSSIFYIKKISNINKTTSTGKKNINGSNFNNLDRIGNQTLQLIRLILIMSTIFCIFLIWSEFHYILQILETITIWDVTSTITIQGTNNIQPITLKTLLNTILIFFITIQTTKKLPSLLQLTILEYLHLTPSTNYAVVTLTKYIFMLLGVIIGLSNIGIEWSKLQWLIAAIGVGLGFGLQEIFANFISGLIILFEKPIRIGDTITIYDFTGRVTKIKTRATTIIDRNHKEIIIPNKEFITKKFTNWSLSDTITRVVLKVPAHPSANITKVNQILLKAVKSCPFILDIPAPEIYLIDVEKGVPLFEIRIYTSKMSHRMLLKHQVHMLIIHFYKKNGLELPLFYKHPIINNTN